MRVVRILGEGSQGVVALCTHRDSSAAQIIPNDDFNERLEGTAAAASSHFGSGLIKAKEPIQEERARTPESPDDKAFVVKLFSHS